MKKAETVLTETHAVTVEGPSFAIQGDLGIPAGAVGVVLFAHGSGSSRMSPRNRFVAEVLRSSGLATLLIDLLTFDEEKVDAETGRLRFDIEFLTERLVLATDWLKEESSTKELQIGYFGASTGSAAALVAATRRPRDIKAIVSRGGRPDLAERALPEVKAPTLLIVGGADLLVLDLNEEALGLLNVEKELAIVPGATHLFEEAGALERVAELAKEWFLRYLGVQA